METVFNMPSNGTIDDYWRIERYRPSRITYETKIEVAGQKVVLAEEVKQENNKLIDQKDQTNVSWQTIVECKGKFVMIGYVDHLDKPAREKARQDHTIPPVFKEFLDGFKCDKE